MKKSSAKSRAGKKLLSLFLTVLMFFGTIPFSSIAKAYAAKVYPTEDQMYGYALADRNPAFAAKLRGFYTAHKIGTDGGQCFTFAYTDYLTYMFGKYTSNGEGNNLYVGDIREITAKNLRPTLRYTKNASNTVTYKLTSGESTATLAKPLRNVDGTPQKDTGGNEIKVSGSVTKSNLESFFGAAKCGDIIQYVKSSGTPHTVIFLLTDGTYVWSMSSNGWEGKWKGKVTVDKHSISEFEDFRLVSLLKLTDDFLSVIHSCNYDESGVCKSCKNSFEYTEHVLNATFTPNSGGAQSYSTPYAVKANETSLHKKTIRVKTELSNAFGTKWYKTTAGDYVCSNSGTVDATKSAFSANLWLSYYTLAEETDTNIERGAELYFDGEVKSAVHLKSATARVKNTATNATVFSGSCSASGKEFYVSEISQEWCLSSLPIGTYSYYVTVTDLLDNTTTKEKIFNIVEPLSPTYTVIYSSEDSVGTPEDCEVSRDSDYTIPDTIPIRDGYAFLGWETTSGAAAAAYQPGDVFSDRRNVTFYAVWEEALPPAAAPALMDLSQNIGVGMNLQLSWRAVSKAANYSVTLKDENDNVFYSKTTPATSLYVNMSEAGTYTVTVKALNAYGEGPSASGVAATVHAPSTVRFLDYDGAVLSEQRIDYGESATAPTPPPRNGYTFVDWDASYRNITADADVTAQYAAIDYTVTFLDYNGLTVGSPQVLHYGDAAVPPADSELAIPMNYARIGWSTEDFLFVTKNLTVKPSIAWANPDIPITTSITSVTPSGSGYWVDFSVTNYPDGATTGRAVVVLKSATGRFLTKTESNAFYLAANEMLDSHLYVPCAGVPEGSTFATAEVHIVNSYSSLIPIAVSGVYNMLGEESWTDWMTEEQFAAYTGDKSETQTKTEYDTRDRLPLVETTAASYSDWELLSTRTVKSDYGSWSAWSDTAITANENREVETRQTLVTAAYNQYRYGRWASTTSSKGSFWYHFCDVYAKSKWGGTWYLQYTAWSTTRVGASTVDYGRTSSKPTQPSGSALRYTRYSGGYYYWNKYVVSSKPYYWEEINTVPAVYKTQYRYRTRTDVTLNTFGAWDAWKEAWRETPVSATTMLDVRTRTLTRASLPIATDMGMTVSGQLENGAQVAGRNALIFVHKVDEASDYSNEFIGHTTLDASGGYSFNVSTFEDVSVKTGDFTIALAIEGSDEPVFIGKIDAPKPFYTVSFVDWDGYLIGDAQSVQLGDDASAPEAPQRAGYTFLGWDTGVLNIRSDTTINAVYAPKDYSVVFVDWNNEYVSLSTGIEYGSSVEAPTAEPVEGYNFVCWAPQNSMDLNNVTGNMVVEAQYEPLSYTVRFYDSEDTVLSEQNVSYGNAATEPTENIVPAEGDLEFWRWDNYEFMNVTSDLDVHPVTGYWSDAYVWADVESGLYYGSQTITLESDVEGAQISYLLANETELEELAQDGEADTVVYTAPITVSENSILTVFCSAEGHNNYTQSYSYRIIPESERPAEPQNLQLDVLDESIMVEWEAPAAAPDGYIITRTDGWGCVNTCLVTSSTSYADVDVSPFERYNYTMQSFNYGSGSNDGVIIESLDTAPAAATFYGPQLAVQSIAVTSDALTAYVGDYLQMNAMITPANAYNPDVEWSVTPGTGNATITSGGMLKAVSAGTVTVTAEALDGAGAVSSTEVTILAASQGTAVLQLGSGTITKGGTKTISLTATNLNDVAAMQLCIRYDSSLLTLTEAAAGSAIESLSPTINSSVAGVVYFNWDATAGVNFNGSLLDMTFTAATDAETTETLIYIDSDEFILSSLDGSGGYVSINNTVLKGRLNICDVVFGDVDGNDRVNVLDANLVRRHAARLVTLEDVSLVAADVNADGSVNVLDANLIRRHAARLISEFPASA